MTTEVITEVKPETPPLPKNEYLESVGSSLYVNPQVFKYGWQVSTALSRSSMVPKDYRDSPENCMIAFDLSLRLNVSPFLVMQKVAMVHGKPCMEGQLCIALANERGGFDEPLDWEFGGEGDARWCKCFTFRAGKRIESSPLTLKQVKDAGWYAQNKNWQVITDQMFRYRTASFLVKTHNPGIMMGLDTRDEIVDVAGLPSRGSRRSSLNDIEIETTKEKTNGKSK